MLTTVTTCVSDSQLWYANMLLRHSSPQSALSHLPESYLQNSVSVIKLTLSYCLINWRLHAHFHAAAVRITLFCITEPQFLSSGVIVLEWFREPLCPRYPRSSEIGSAVQFLRRVEIDSDRIHSSLYPSCFHVFIHTSLIQEIAATDHSYCLEGTRKLNRGDTALCQIFVSWMFDGVFNMNLQSAQWSVLCG